MFALILTRLICWGAMATGVFACAIKLDPLWGLPAAITVWAGGSALMCGIGALLLETQPLGVATKLGAFGGSFVRWGFLAGRGKLFPAVAISWLIWTGLGIAAIAATKYRADHQFLLLDLAWVVDAGVLLRFVGIILVNKKAPLSILKVVAVLIAMLVASTVLWSIIGTDKSRQAALLIAGGPPLLIGGGYALFLLVMMTVGRGARWN